MSEVNSTLRRLIGPDPRSATETDARSLPEAKDSQGTDNTSRLVQAGLRELVAPKHELPAFVTSQPDVDADLLSSITTRMQTEAREIYEHGYALGVELARVMPWELLDRIAEYDFDLEQLEEDLVGRHVIPGAEDWADALGMARDLWEVSQEKRQRYGTTMNRATRQALRDIWLAVQQSDANQGPGDGAALRRLQMSGDSGDRRQSV